MTCYVCSRAYYTHAIPETGCSTDLVILSETGSVEAHQLEETILFNKVATCRHFRWRQTKYWLKQVPALTGKCCPELIANLATRSHRPIAIANTQLRKSCVFDHVGPRPLCFVCACQLAGQRNLLLLIIRGKQVFALGHGRHANLKGLRAALHVV